jgi:capsular polysaccharide biosynthesis protein
VYSSQGYLWVSSGRSDTSDYEATQTNLVLSKTYAELLGSQLVALEVADRLPFRSSGSAVEQAVAVAPVAQSQLIRVSAEATSAERARTLADVYLATAVERAAELSRAHDETDVVTLAQPADLPTAPVRPKPLLYLLVGALLAAALAFAVAMLCDRLDTAVRPAAEASELVGVPILARVARRRRRSTARRRRPAERERDAAMRAALVNLALLNHGTRPESIAVTTVTAREEGTTWAQALAQAANAAELDVLLVERGPAPGRSRRDGGTAAGERSSGTDDGHVLHVVPALADEPGTALLGGQDGLPSTKRAGTARYDLSVHDAGALLITSDAAVLAAASEATIVVVESGRTDERSLRRAVERLGAVHAQVVGILLVDHASTPDQARFDRRDRSADGPEGPGPAATAAGPADVDGAPVPPSEDVSTPPPVTSRRDPS